MSEHEHGTIPMQRPGTDSGRPTESGFAAFAPEIQDAMYRRLSLVAIVYAGTWLANYLYFNLVIDHAIDPIWHIVSSISIGIGVAVWLLARKERIPPRHFTNFAAAFEVAGAIGIMAGSWGWEHRGIELLERVARALDIPSADIVTRLVLPLDAEGARILYAEGVSWVAVWMLVYPFLVPARLGRTIVTTLLTAAVVPAFMGASLLVNGIPDATRPWVGNYVTDATVPVFICAGISILSSRFVFRLTRDLSDARRMGSYRLVEKIGEGGMGEVWKAKHRMLVRPAAIKLVRSGGDRDGAEHPTANAVRRFQQEAQATAELSSPHSIELYDFGITDDGTFYYVMELLNGIDLRTLVDRYGPLPPERAVHILRQACHSLADAHETGMVHRDVKPANVFVCRSGSEFDFVKVLDFGLVKQIGSLDEGASQLTIDGFAGGTPAFMAPEMARGGDNVDGRADLYGLGCVAYWLLTGSLVFEGDSPVAVLARHLGETPEPPSSRTELPVPPELDRLVLDCLAKDPKGRPAGARELADRLAACAQGLPPWSERRAAEWWQIHLPQFCRAPGATPAPAAT